MLPASQGRGEKRHTRATPRKVIIIGSGPAGYTAAIYAARANLAPLMINGVQAGGQLMLTTHVENYPGFVDPVLGPELMETMRKQAERFGTDMLGEDVVEVDFTRRPFVVRTADAAFEGQTIVIATGATARMLGLPSETLLIGHGVSTCATCDGFFFKDQDVVVVGGGDSALEEALYLARLVRSVAVVHLPNTAIFRGQVDLLPSGYVRVEPGTTRTSVPGVFAAGDAQDSVFRQAVTAAGTGCMGTRSRTL